MNVRLAYFPSLLATYLIFTLLLSILYILATPHHIVDQIINWWVLENINYIKELYKMVSANW